MSIMLSILSICLLKSCVYISFSMSTMALETTEECTKWIPIPSHFWNGIIHRITFFFNVHHVEHPAHLPLEELYLFAFLTVHIGPGDNKWYFHIDSQALLFPKRYNTWDQTLLKHHFHQQFLSDGLWALKEHCDARDSQQNPDMK